MKISGHEAKIRNSFQFKINSAKITELISGKDWLAEHFMKTSYI